MSNPTSDEIFDEVDTLYAENKIDQALTLLSSKLEEPIDPIFKIRILIYQSHLHSIKEEYDKSIELAERAEHLANTEQSDILVVKALIEKLYSSWLTGDISQAQEVLKQASNTSDKLSDNEFGLQTKADLYNIAGIIYDNIGENSRALDYFTKSLNYREKLGHEEDMAVSLNNIAIIQQAMGRYDEALESLSRSFDLKKKYGNDLDIATWKSNLALYHKRVGKLEESISLTEEAIDLFKDYGTIQDLSNCYLNLVLFGAELEKVDIVQDAVSNLETIRETNQSAWTDSTELNYKLAICRKQVLDGDFKVAENSLEELIGEEIIDHTLHLVGMQLLIDVKLNILKDQFTKPKLIGLTHIISRLKKLAVKEHLYPTLVHALLLEARLYMLQKEYEKSGNLLLKAHDIAKKRDLNVLLNRVEDEITEFDEVIKNNSTSRIEIGSSLESYIDLMRRSQ